MTSANFNLVGCSGLQEGLLNLKLQGFKGFGSLEALGLLVSRSSGVAGFRVTLNFWGLWGFG